MGASSGSSYRSGILFGLVAYVSWGLVPLYFHFLVKPDGSKIPALEILAHRILWAMALLTVISIAFGGWRDVLRVLRSPRLVATLGLSAVLLSANWLLYIYATVTDRVAEASLGYYMMPLVNAFLATMVLGEKLRRAHYPALGLVACAVLAPIAIKGDFTWIAAALPVSFACYGLVRKLAPVESLTGLTVETLLMVVPSAIYLLMLDREGAGSFGADWGLNSLLMASAVVTVVPLLTYTLSLRRMPLLANSFLQFVSPTIQLLLATFVLHETMTPDRWAAIGFVWVAVAIFLTDAAIQLRTKRTAEPAAKPLLPVSAVVEPILAARPRVARCS